jgi:3-oxoacyl-[acyl-carrier-protein] synthase-1
MMHARRAPLRVTGYSVLSAVGTSRDEHLAAFCEGRSGLAFPTTPLSFETAVGEVKAPLPELPPALAARSTRMARMAAQLLQQIDEPLRRARARWRPERIGVLLGTSTAGMETTERAYRTFVREGVFPARYHFEKQHTFGAILHVVSALSGARGPAWTSSTACTSSGRPFATAARLIAADVIDAALVGGIDTLCTMTLQGFQSLQALDRIPCRPFHRKRAGISLGEGGALALVERGGDARVLGSGIGETSDANHNSAPHPQGRGAAAAMRAAGAQAGCTGAEVDHVNAHGTGTRLNDVAEATAIARCVPASVPVVSTKGFTGHALGAAAALELVFAACAIEEGWIPPSLGADDLDPEIGLSVPATLTRGRFRRVLSNSFAFGGNNVSLLLEAP